MKYKCVECGCVFEDDEIIKWAETHGLKYGPYETFTGCPHCKNGYEEATKCKICGEWFLEEELNGGCVCDDCVEEYHKQFTTCYKIADTEKDAVEINSLLTYLLTPSEIEAVLFNHLKEADKINRIDCSFFINENKDWFAEKLVEGGE